MRYSILTFLLFLYLCVPIVLSDSTPLTFPICSDPATQDVPAVSGDIVVWQDERNGNYDIYGYDLTIGLCINKPRSDVNNDCVVDIVDFAIMASEWLDCGLEPQSTCWE